MWNIFKSKQIKIGQEKEEFTEEEIRAHHQQRIDKHMKHLITKLKDSQEELKNHFVLNQSEIEIGHIFKDVIGTLQGLVSIIEGLKKQSCENQNKLQEYEKLKEMVANHQQDITSMQEINSNSLRKLYQQKSDLEEKSEEKISILVQQNQKIKAKLNQIDDQLQLKQKKIQNMKGQIQQLTKNLKKSEDMKVQYYERLDKILMSKDFSQKKRQINLDKITLDYAFYYSKIRDKLNQFLDISDILNLKMVNKFYKYTVKKEESKLIYRIGKTNCQKIENENIKKVTYFEKIYELFPSENVKFNAIKYFVFKIKPGTYILPFLQQNIHLEEEKARNQQEEQKQGKFSWKSVFNFSNNQKKQSKFSLSNLKNEQQFHKIQKKIQEMFSNLLDFSMPDDLKYYQQNMERQLEELKVNLNDHKKQKTTIIEWSSQLVCLSKFMYMQVNQMHHLLLVLFGNMVKMNEKYLDVSEKYGQLRENQKTLRGLIESISSEKHKTQKKMANYENQLLKVRMDKQIAQRLSEKQKNQKELLSEQNNILINQLQILKKQYKTNVEEKKEFQQNMSKVRQELQKYDKTSLKIRKYSIGSAKSQQSK